MAEPTRKESVLDRVRKLINLAASSNLKEAERAAYKACALIRDGGLDVCDPAEIDGIYKDLAETQAKVRQLEAPLASPDPDDDLDLTHWGLGPGPMPRTTSSSPTTTPPQPVRLTSTFPGRCKQCLKPYQPGDLILWARGRGCWCATSSCFNDWLAVQHFKP